MHGRREVNPCKHIPVNNIGPSRTERRSIQQAHASRRALVVPVEVELLEAAPLRHPQEVEGAGRTISGPRRLPILAVG